MKKEELRRKIIEKDFLSKVVIDNGRWEWNKDGSVDIIGKLYLTGSKHIEKIPVKIRKLSGNFFSRDSGITTLENCPDFIAGDFCISYNNFTNTVYFPKKIIGGVYDYGTIYTEEIVKKMCTVIGEIKTT